MKFLLVLALISCHLDPEAQMKAAGAPEPVICLTRDYMTFCRDGVGKFWFCRHVYAGIDTCMPTDTPQKYFDLKAVQAEIQK